MARKPTYKELEEKIAALEKAVIAHKKIAKKRAADLDLFENSPVAQAEIDCSRLKRYFEKLLRDGVTDFYAFFQEDQAVLHQCLDRIKLVRANKASHMLFHTEEDGNHSKDIMQNIKDEEGLDNFRRGMAAMAEGAMAF